MKISQNEYRLDSTDSGNKPPRALPRKGRHLARLIASAEKKSLGISAGILVFAVAIAFFPAIRATAQSAQAPEQPSAQRWHLPDIPWAFPIRGKVQPLVDQRPGEIHVPGSTKTYTQEQIDDLQNPPDWFPDEHAPMPRVVAHGAPGGVLGCASCHLASGLGHPESANLAGMSAEYIERQLADFKALRRMGEAMNDMTKELSEEDGKQAAEWFSALQPKIWQPVVETDTVPQTFVNEHLMRMPLPGGSREPIGNRIIELPQDVAGAESRDPHSGFIAYVPKGSIAKGKEFVTTGGGGKTIQCVICHGPTLNGLGEVPAIAGHSPMYLFRQLYYFKDGSRHGSMGALMKGVVAQMTQDDMLAIAAYVGSLPPGKQDSASRSLPPTGRANSTESTWVVGAESAGSTKPRATPWVR